MDKHQVSPENATLIRTWLEQRGGIAIWRSADLSDPGASVTTPVNAEDGTPTQKPGWKWQATPERIITSIDEVEVVVPEEVKRFRVALRRGGNGLKIKLTDAASKRVRDAVAKAGEGAWYEFGGDAFSGAQAIIYKPGMTIPLATFHPPAEM